MSQILKRAWIPLLIVVVFAIGGLVVFRMHGFFGSNNEITRPGAGLAEDAEPFDPKVVRYEIFGMEGAVATINYLDLDAVPQIVRDAPLPCRSPSPPPRRRPAPSSWPRAMETALVVASWSTTRSRMKRRPTE
jgi:hypothetical protein